MTTRWEPAFLSVSAALGEPYGVALEALGDLGALNAAEMVRAFRSPRREARAKAIAAGLAEVVHALDATRLSWP
jgi:hypothetical protein